MLSDGSIYCFKICIYFFGFIVSDVQVTNSIGTNAHPYNQRGKILYWTLTTKQMGHVLFSPEDPVSMFSKKKNKKQSRFLFV